MMLTQPAAAPAYETPERRFGAVELLSLVLEAAQPSLGFDLAVAVICEDGRHVVPVFTTATLTPAVTEGAHVQALAAFIELAGVDHASWPSDEPTVITLAAASSQPLAEPEEYEDAPLVVGGGVTGMLRVHCARPLSPGQRALYFAMASDVSKAIERLDAQRTQARLVQERLLQSEKMSSVGQLVSGVAHELNNPLTGIMGFAQLLLLRELDDTAHRQVETIYAEAERASKIVDNLLTFARRRKAQKEPANLNTLMERVLELLNYDLRVRNIETTLHLDPDLPETMVDANQLQQVFLNIIINAEQAMRAASDGGEGTLRISSSHADGMVRIVFKDSGPGMSSETMRRIFDPFFTTKEAGEGTGLGLAISYGIIEEHGGRIWAESEVGRGTSFVIEVPVVAGVAAAPREPAEAAPAATVVDRKRVLVVDDEDSIQRLLTGVLEMDGHDVQTANNGREALDRIEHGEFDLIITDIKMPVMGGPDLYKLLRSAGNPLARRVIFITGDTVAPDTRRFLQGVDNAVLAKPFRLRDVRDAVRAALER
jgi:two-component system NtrC family sensor kinase